MSRQPSSYPSHAKRDQLLEKHPVRLDSYCIPTPQLQSAYSIVRERVWMQHTGLVFCGTPRMGKTVCARAIGDLLRTDFDDARVLLLVFNSRPLRPKEGHLHRLLLTELDMAPAASARDALILLRRFANAIEQILAPHHGTQFVLLIDEMQLMHPLDFQQLLAIHNELDIRGIRMTTIGFAQTEIMHTRSAFQETEQLQIIGRFLTDMVPFCGCSTREDLTKILEYYDFGSDFPEKSGWSYTNFFIPEAFAHGVRLSKVSEEIWTALLTATHGRETYGIPMCHLCLTVKYLLFRLRLTDSALMTITEKDVTNAVASSGLLRFVGGLGGVRES